MLRFSSCALSRPGQEQIRISTARLPSTLFLGTQTSDCKLFAVVVVVYNNLLTLNKKAHSFLWARMLHESDKVSGWLYSSPLPLQYNYLINWYISTLLYQALITYMTSLWFWLSSLKSNNRFEMLFGTENVIGWRRRKSALKIPLPLNRTALILLKPF